MTRPVPLLVACLAAASVGACVSPVARQEGVTVTGSVAAPSVQVVTAPAPGATTATWQMPAQISPSGAGSDTTVAWVPGTGFVSGTRPAIETVGRPLVQAPGRNRTVEACRTVVVAEAQKLGATQIEAASAGPDRVERGGRILGPVDVRITYPGTLGYEVRTARMTCVVDPNGRILDAFV